MAEDNKELLTELARLRDDLKQLQEVVNVLVNVVMEDDLDEEEESEWSTIRGSENRFNMYN